MGKKKRTRVIPIRVCKPWKGEAENPWLTWARDFPDSFYETTRPEDAALPLTDDVLDV